MTRFAYMDDDDQTTLRLDALGGLSKDELRMRPPGVKPLGSVALYCPRLVADGVVCYGQLWHTTDQLGRLVTICTRPGCRHVAVVPRVRAIPTVKQCGKCHRQISGPNAAQREDREPVCRFCQDAKNARARERERTKRSAA